MTPQDKIKALAELDGWSEKLVINGIFAHRDKDGNIGWPPSYLTSYDAIIPLIQKQDKNDSKVGDMFYTKFQDTLLRLTYPTKLTPPAYAVEELMVGCYALQRMLTATPTQLADALLIATGKMKG